MIISGIHNRITIMGPCIEPTKCQNAHKCHNTSTTNVKIQSSSFHLIIFLIIIMQGMSFHIFGARISGKNGDFDISGRNVMTFVVDQILTFVVDVLWHFVGVLTFVGDFDICGLYIVPNVAQREKNCRDSSSNTPLMRPWTLLQMDIRSFGNEFMHVIVPIVEQWHS